MSQGPGIDLTHDEPVDVLIFRGQFPESRM